MLDMLFPIGMKSDIITCANLREISKPVPKKPLLSWKSVATQRAELIATKRAG